METSAAPEFTSPLIERPRLLAELDAAEARGVRAICLVAPAGYGKTVLAEQWVRSRHPDAIWHYATEVSMDVTNLVTSMAREAENFCPGLTSLVTNRLRAGGASASQETLAELIIDAFRRLPVEPWLVIDDLHLVGDGAASHLINSLSASRSARLVVTSRARPRLASARRVLYEDAAVIARDSLELDDSEVRVLVASVRGTAQPNTLPRWPVLARLALNQASLPEHPSTDSDLFRFVADEVFSGLSAETQIALTFLAICPDITTPVARIASGKKTYEFLNEGVEAGLLDRGSRGEFQLHSLIRGFLLERFASVEADSKRSVSRRVFAHYLHERRPDAAFATATLSASHGLVVRLLRSSYRVALDSGKLETVQLWLSSVSPNHPVAKLVRAELALVTGNVTRSMSLADAVSQDTALRPSERVRSLCLAGLAAYLSGDIEKAEAHYQSALDDSRSRTRRADALWGLLTAASLVGGARSQDLLSEYRASANPSPTTHARVAIGRLNLVSSPSDWLSGLPEARCASEVIGDVPDPRVRASFWCVFADRLVQAGCPTEATVALDALSEDVRTSGLAFAEPRILAIRARVDLLERRFTRCSLRLDQADAVAANDRNAHYVVYATRTMLRLAQHRAVSTPEGIREGSPKGGLIDQALCWCALEQSVSGNPVEATRLAQRLLAQSSIISVQNVARFATAIVLAASHPTDAEHALRQSARECVRVGDTLTVVCAYRAWPDMLPHLLNDEVTGSAVARLVLRFDRQLASKVGLESNEPRGSQDAGREALSRRESEVLGLLTEGLTNREIAKRLFIAESTAKLHVRRVCAKLGVRSRTEAALRAIH